MRFNIEFKLFPTIFTNNVLILEGVEFRPGFRQNHSAGMSLWAAGAWSTAGSWGPERNGSGDESLLIKVKAALCQFLPQTQERQQSRMVAHACAGWLGVFCFLLRPLGLCVASWLSLQFCSRWDKWSGGNESLKFRMVSCYSHFCPHTVG